MVLTLLLLATAPVATQPSTEDAIVCKVIKDHALKSRRVTACGTDAEWRAYRAAVQRAERETVGRNVALSGATSGF